MVEYQGLMVMGECCADLYQAFQYRHDKENINEDNKYITLVTENETQTYEVFSVYQIEAEDYYIKTKFNTEKEFEKFLQTIKKRSIKDFNVDISKKDTILTLSTCANNNKYRVVLHAKKI